MSRETESTWMTGVEACAALCLSVKPLAKLAQAGRIGTLTIPGVKKTLYSRADVERLAEAGRRPATNPATVARNDAIVSVG